jgi:hypothetical protein
MLCRLFANVTLVRDVGIEPTSSRLKGECISISANPANESPQNLVGDAGIEPALSRLRGECICHLCQSPIFNINMFNIKNGAGGWNRTNASRLSTAGSTFELILPVRKLWCAVWELNPHLLGVGQLFWSVELPARKIGRGCRSRTCLAALIWRRSGYKPLPLAGGPSIGGSRWIRTIRDGFMRAAFFLLN